MGAKKGEFAGWLHFFFFFFFLVRVHAPYVVHGKIITIVASHARYVPVLLYFTVQHVHTPYHDGLAFGYKDRLVAPSW
jgi:hypothetical protein